MFIVSVVWVWVMACVWVCERCFSVCWVGLIVMVRLLGGLRLGLRLSVLGVYRCLVGLVLTSGLAVICGVRLPALYITLYVFRFGCLRSVCFGCWFWFGLVIWWVRWYCVLGGGCDWWFGLGWIWWVVSCLVAVVV